MVVWWCGVVVVWCCGGVVVWCCGGVVLFSTFVLSGVSKGCHHKENKGRFRRNHYPRLNRNSSAHSDELTLK